MKKEWNSHNGIHKIVAQTNESKFTNDDTLAVKQVYLSFVACDWLHTMMQYRKYSLFDLLRQINKYIASKAAWVEWTMKKHGQNLCRALKNWHIRI